MAHKDCIDAIEKALGRPPTEDEVIDIAEAVQQRMRRKIADGLSPRDAAAEVGEDMTREAKLAKTIARADAYNNLLKHADLMARTVPGEELLSERSVLAGRARGSGRGFADSVDSNHHSLRAQLVGPATAELANAKLLKVMRTGDPRFDADVARELYRRKDPTLGPATGNARAVEAARILGNVMDAGRAMMNKAGAFIGEVEGYMGRQYHDMFKVRGVGPAGDFAAWRDVAMKEFNLDKMYPDLTPERINSALRETWQSLATGRFDSATNESLNGFNGGRNLGKKVSQQRSIIFNDADAWVRYNQKFGKGSVMDAVWAGADSAARDTAIMGKFGTNPQAMFDKWHDENVQALYDRGEMAKGDALKGNPNKGLFDTLTGAANHPASQTIATMGATVRNVMQLIHLGGVVFSTISDLPMTMGTLRHNGVPFWKALTEQMSALFPKGEDTKELAMAMGAGIDGMTGHIIHRFRLEDGMPGKMADAVNTFHRWNGLQYETDSMKRGMGLALSHNLAFHADKEFAALPELMQATMRRYGIEAPEWDIARAANKTAADGRAYLMPAEIENPAVSRKMWNLITDQIREGMNEPTAAARQFSTMGTQSGTYWGEITRSIFQFKSFTYSFMQRSGGRTFLRGPTVDWPGAVYLLAGMTLAGYASNALRDLAANRVTATPTDAEGWGALVARSMVAGGAAGFYGDVLLRQGGKSAGDVAKQMIGPAPATAFDLVSAWNSIAQGSNKTERSTIAKKEAIQLLQHNFPNIPIAKAATDYMLLHFLMESVAPGSVARHDRAMRKQGQTYILRP